MIAISVASLTDGRVEITVRDNGIGILPEDAPHIFDRYKADKAHTSGRARAGAAICKMILTGTARDPAGRQPGGQRVRVHPQERGQQEGETPVKMSSGENQLVPE